MRLADMKSIDNKAIAESYHNSLTWKLVGFGACFIVVGLVQMKEMVLMSCEQSVLFQREGTASFSAIYAGVSTKITPRNATVFDKYIPAPVEDYVMTHTAELGYNSEEQDGTFGKTRRQHHSMTNCTVFTKSYKPIHSW